MSNTARATHIINETYADEYVKMHMTPRKVAAALADAGLLTPAPQIIHTIETAHGTHADSIIMSEDGAVGHGREACEADLPAVVVRAGAGVRACREALEGETT